MGKRPAFNRKEYDYLVFDRSKAVRHYVGKFRYPDKEEFLVGNVTIPLETSESERIMILNQEFDTAWKRILPDHFERPALVGYIEGSIFFG